MTVDDALARALHELRGPLGAVRLGVELGLRRGSLSREQLCAVELELERASRALADLEHVASGGVGRRGGLDATTTGRAPLALAPLLVASVAAWRPAAGPRAMRLDLGSGPEPWVMGERARLAQATGNLLANAIEHGAGTISVRLGQAGATLRVEVEDEGPGLRAPLLELLRRRAHHGLRVAAEVAEECGGRLLSAPSHQGARLVLELPRAAAAAEAERAAAS